MPVSLELGATCAVVRALGIAQARQRRSTVLKRAVTRVVTPGTLIEERFLDPRAHQFLAALAVGPQGQGGVAWIDISTGLLRLAPSSAAAVVSDVARIQAKEVVLDRGTPEAIVATLRASKQLLVSTIDQLPENSHDGATTAAEVDLAQALFRRAFEGVKLQDFSPLELDAVTLLFQVGTGRPRVGA